MNRDRIIITDLMGSKKIDINTPVLILTNVTCSYLLPHTSLTNVYYVDVVKLHNDLLNSEKFINNFIPVGQIQINDLTKTFTLIMANVLIIPVTTSFEEITKNIWIGVIRKNDKICRSLGTIYNVGKPPISIPVFPNSFLKKLNAQFDDLYDDLYSYKKYDRWAFNKYKFNIDKKNLKIIDGMGEINNMYIPMTTMNINVNNNDISNMYNHKEYFSTQGSIAKDNHCISPKQEFYKISLNHCNTMLDQNRSLLEENLNNNQNNNQRLIDHRLLDQRLLDQTLLTVEPTIEANDEGLLSMNESREYKVESCSKKNNSGWFKKGDTLILKEKDDPWFLDQQIVGNVLNISDPHKVTGQLYIVDSVNNTINDSVNHSNNNSVNNTVTENNSLLNTIHKSKLKTKQQLIKNTKILIKDQYEDLDHENFDNNEEIFNYNNIIMFIICIIILILLIYRIK